MDKTDFSAFGQYIPGFDFLQSLARQASGVKPDLQPAAGVMSSLGHWVAPTFSVEEIEKRIHDLRAVEFWLDQNSKALAATIQALEVQKMTLATLENMNLSLKDVAESFKIKPETVQAQAAPRAAKAAEPPVQDADESVQAGSKTGVDPMQWWNSLTEQFTTIASSAVQDMAGQAAKAAEQVAQTVQASAEAAEKMAEQARQEVEAAAARAAAQASEQVAASASQRPKAPARKTAATAAKKAATPRSRRKPAAE
jgi:hypothetical protein